MSPKAKVLFDFEADKSKVVVKMQMFRDLCEVLNKLISEKGISSADLRT